MKRGFGRPYRDVQAAPPAIQPRLPLFRTAESEAFHATRLGTESCFGAASKGALATHFLQSQQILHSACTRWADSTELELSVILERN